MRSLTIYNQLLWTCFQIFWPAKAPPFRTTGCHWCRNWTRNGLSVGSLQPWQDLKLYLVFAGLYLWLYTVWLCCSSRMTGWVVENQEQVFGASPAECCAGPGPRWFVFRLTVVLSCRAEFEWKWGSRATEAERIRTKTLRDEDKPRAQWKGFHNGTILFQWLWYIIQAEDPKHCVIISKWEPPPTERLCRSHCSKWNNGWKILRLSHKDVF